MDHGGNLRRIERGNVAQTGSTGDQPHALRGRDQHLLQGFAAVEHMADVERRMRSQRDLRIGHAQVGVQQHHLVAAHGQSHSQIDRHGGFTGPPFAAGDTDDLGETFFIHEQLWQTTWPSQPVA